MDVMNILERMPNDTRVRVIDKNSGAVSESNVENIKKWMEGLDNVFKGECDFVLDRDYKHCPRVIKGSIVCLKNVWQPGEVLEVTGDIMKVDWLNDHKIMDYNLNLIENDAMIVVNF